MQKLKRLPKEIQEQILCETLDFYTFPILYSEFKDIINVRCREYITLLSRIDFLKYSQDPELNNVMLKDFSYGLNWKYISKCHVLNISFIKEFSELLDFKIISLRNFSDTEMDSLAFIKNQIDWNVIPLSDLIIKNFGKLIPIYILISYKQNKIRST